MALKSIVNRHEWNMCAPPSASEISGKNLDGKKLASHHSSSTHFSITESSIHLQEIAK
jgi:hypothetical protein